jgi:hypothetical protein
VEQLSDKGSLQPVKLVKNIVSDIFRFTQKVNDITAFTAAIEGLHAKGLRGEELYKSAERFIQDVRPPSDKLNAPLILRGAFALPMTFKGWSLNYLTLLSRNLSKGEFKATAEMLVPLVALGGVGALPFAKELFDAFEKFGVDARGMLKRGAPSWVNAGLMSLVDDEYAPNVLGKIQPGLGIPTSILSNPAQAVGEIVAGPYGTMVRKGKETFDFAKEGKYGKAAESALPPGLPSGSLKAYRASQIGPDGKEVGLRDKKNRPLLYDKARKPRALTGAEKAMVVLGVQPKSVGDEYIKSRSISMLNQDYSDKASKWIERLAEARYQRDLKLFNKLLKEAKADGYRPDPNAVLEATRKKQYGDRMSRIKSSPRPLRPEVRDILNDR